MEASITLKNINTRKPKSGDNLDKKLLPIITSSQSNSGRLGTWFKTNKSHEVLRDIFECSGGGGL